MPFTMLPLTIPAVFIRMGRRLRVAWMAAGLVTYVIYRRAKGMSLTKTVKALPLPAYATEGSSGLDVCACATEISMSARGRRRTDSAIPPWPSPPACLRRPARRCI